MKNVATLAVMFVLGGVTTTAVAGIADSPLPVLQAGAATVHLYSVSGVMHQGTPGTFFTCTSTDTVPMKVGVEVFDFVGNFTNDVAATSLSVAPGATVMFGTSAAVGIVIDSNVGGLIGNGSARILATSKKLVCNAFVADTGNAPPTSMMYLTIIAKTKQKAAN